MTVATLITRKVAKDLYREAHHVAYKAASMFLEKHSIKQGHTSNGGLFIQHGYINDEGDVVPIMKLVNGDKLRNKEVLRQISQQGIMRLLRQSFVGNQAWLTHDIQVSVKRLMEPIAQFVADNAEHFEVFGNVYENKLTHTNVLGIYISLKGVRNPADHIAWEITIDDIDLDQALTGKAIFSA